MKIIMFKFIINSYIIKRKKNFLFINCLLFLLVIVNINGFDGVKEKIVILG